MEETRIDYIVVTTFPKCQWPVQQFHSVSLKGHKNMGDTRVLHTPAQ